MRLTSIRLVGFKSFVDPVTVPFDGNMTAIVGPNGCGKSNIIDAVRWVMGESSAKTLRGESMADVIFNGSTGRKPISQASIELKFDNRDGGMGGVYAQYAEIAVRRLVTRDGQSNYFFNGQKCRRRDIADLFMGTGLGPRSYAIIGQGMISRLIEARPDDLRSTLEEAAGISKYKERRRETENRMRRTQENLERLDDIREELDKQLERLKRQAEAAKRYQDLKEQEYRLKGELALLRGRALRAEQSHQESRVRELEIAVEKDVFGVRQCETRLEQAREQHDELSEVLDRHQQQFFETTTRIARLEQDQAHRRSRETQLASDIATARRELDEQRRVSEGDQARLAAIDERFDDLLPEHEALEEQLESLEQALADASPALEAAEQQWADAETRWRDASRDADRSQDQLRDLEQRIARLQAENQRRRQQRSEVADLTALREEHAVCEAQLADAQQQAEGFQTQRDQWQQRYGDAKAAYQQATQARDQQRAELSQRQGELASLQALMDAALADHDPAIGTTLEAHGLADAPQLGEVLQVAPGWETLVSWLLAPWLNARLVAREQLAALPEALATDWRLIDQTSPAASASGQRLDGLVKNAGALGEWLASIHYTQTAEEAKQQVAHLAPGESVVSQDGVWLGRGWLSQQANGEGIDGLLLTRRRYAELTTQRESEEQALALAEEQCEAASETIETLEQTREQQAEQERAHATTLQRLAVKERSLAQRLEHLESRATELDAELAQLQEDEAELALTIDEQRARWDVAMEQLERAAQAREASAEQRNQQREAREQLTQQHAPLKAQQQALALERERLSAERDSLRSQQARSSDSEERLALRIAELEESREMLIEPDELAGEELEELLHQREQQEGRLNATKQQAQGLAEQLRNDELARQQHERNLEQSREQLQQRRMDAQALALKAATQDEQLAELGHNVETLTEQLPQEATETRWQELLEGTTDKIRRLGAINLAAIEEYDQQAERRNYLEAQHAELTEALETLERAIKRIDQETRVRFRETFEQVNTGLQTLFPRVFGGGAAWLTLTGDDLLETGVAIMARPPGKKNSTIHLLSGGEKALTALSLVFAIFQLNPAPFCMLDEVDAPLDDANVGRYARLVKEMSENVQFIYITHNKIAMEAAERLMGVTMQEPGVSRLVSVGIEEAAALVD
ncbi:chromosome segregation protein SMC [Halomonas sp. ISL-60]|uniref:chromosome segregation protein SMC n=1 Tax=Halomonas sp. ISL-56 TaxID=2819149 RepID=UPI001BE8C44C|nr:chromosome segregation protein SMC [Halomonas sp. ISL-56]MBT2772783.1 chromosome segregation protein SMC [Halomonas sp. ISL-60]MBT2800578.1 chromosome segregation protein SMC [Halomonas sp. ISL-56]